LSDKIGLFHSIEELIIDLEELTTISDSIENLTSLKKLEV
jgi:hypothetical protein